MYMRIASIEQAVESIVDRMNAFVNSVNLERKNKK